MNTSHPNKGRSKALAIKRVPTPHNCCSSSKSPTPQDKRSPYNHKPKSSPHMACSYSQEASLSQEPEASRNYEASLSLQERQEDSQESGMTGQSGQEERMKAESQSQEEGEGEVSGEYQSEKSAGEKFNEISSPKSSRSMGDEEVRERMEEGSEEARSEDEQGDTEEKDDEGEDGKEEEEEVESKEDGEEQGKEEKKLERNVVMERSLNEVRIGEKKEPEAKDSVKPMLKPERSWPLPNPAKKYNLLEDCKILKLAETIRKKQDSKGLMSVSLWESCTDKETGLKLLGNRTGESLRERYRRYLVFLTSEQKEMIKKFAKEHRGEDLGEYSCVFQTVNGKREFVQIERSKKKKDKKPRLETPKKLNIIEDLRQQERSGSSQIRTPRFESHGEKKAPPVSMRGESSGGDVFVQEFEREPVMRCGDGLSLIERIREDRQDFTSMSSVWVRAEDCSRGSQSKRTVKERSRQETVRSNDDVLLKRMAMDDMTLGSYGDMVYWGERKKVKKEVEGKVVEAAAMRSGRDDGYEELREKKPKKMNLNMMICVDEENQMRWFSKRDEEEEEEREKEKEQGWKVEKMRIGKISKEYGIPLHSMLELFNLVSGDYGDLEEYLKKGDENVLWSREDDEGLMMENETAMRYLRRLKGVERMEKRRLYLLGKNVGKGRFLFQKNETRDTR